MYILKEAFAYTHEDIAGVLSVSTDNARKLLSRAKLKLDQTVRSQPTKKVSKEQFKRLEVFTAALVSGNDEQLHQLFHHDIEFRADGGNKVQVVQKYLKGLNEVALLVQDVYNLFQSAYTIQYRLINHQPSILYYEGELLRVCQVFDINTQDNKIMSINSILDPEKLKKIDLV